MPTGLRGVLAERRLLRWLIGAGLAWLLFDFVYYGNTISSPMIVKLVAPHTGLIGHTGVVLAIFAVFALPGYALAAAARDRPRQDERHRRRGLCTRPVGHDGAAARAEGRQLEDLTENRFPSSTVALGVAESRGIRPPAA